MQVLGTLLPRIAEVVVPQLEENLAHWQSQQEVPAQAT